MSDLGAFPFCPESIEEVDPLRFAASAEPEGLVEARAARSRPPRRFRLGWGLMPDAQAYALLDLWRRSVAGILTFDFTPPGASAREASFVPGSLVRRWERPGFFALSLEVVEA